MMLAQAAYDEYRRIHAEQGVNIPSWDDLGHVKRMGWQAAAARFKGHDGATRSDQDILEPPPPPRRQPGTTYNRQQDMTPK